MRLSHIAIACPEMALVESKLSVLGLKVSERYEVTSEKVMAGMIALRACDDLRIELLEPSAIDSPISNFLSTRRHGGLHHLCFEVENILDWERVLTEEGLEVLSPGIRNGARGCALFIHPKSMGGVLVELEEIHRGS